MEGVLALLASNELVVEGQCRKLGFLLRAELDPSLREANRLLSAFVLLASASHSLVLFFQVDALNLEPFGQDLAQRGLSHPWRHSLQIADSLAVLRLETLPQVSPSILFNGRV